MLPIHVLEEYAFLIHLGMGQKVLKSWGDVQTSSMILCGFYILFIWDPIYFGWWSSMKVDPKLWPTASCDCLTPVSSACLCAPKISGASGRFLSSMPGLFLKDVRRYIQHWKRQKHLKPEWYWTSFHIHPYSIFCRMTTYLNDSIWFSELPQKHLWHSKDYSSFLHLDFHPGNTHRDWTHKPKPKSVINPTLTHFLNKRHRFSPNGFNW